MTSRLRSHLFRMVVALVACAAAGVPLRAPAVAAADGGIPFFYEVVRFVQSDGRVLVGGGVRDEGYDYSFAVRRLNGDGTPDLSFNGTGFTRVSVRGYYEFIAAFVVQPDGKIVAGGNSADPIGSGDELCHPAFCRFNPALIRLNADGTLDHTFNGSGRLVIAIGDRNEGEVEEPGDLSRLASQENGKIVVYGHLGATDVATARVNADGTLDTSFAGTDQAAREVPDFGAPIGANFQGMWMTAPRGAASGWGIDLAHQGDVVFATWFTFDANGEPLWLVMSASKTAPAAYAGTLYRTTGSGFDAIPFDPSRVTAMPVGWGSLAFNGPNDGRFAFRFGGVARTMAISKYAFGTPPTCIFGAQPDLALATNYQDHWWAESESGWGLGLTHQGDTILALWLTYGPGGAPLWLVSSTEKTGPATYAGTLFRALGPSFAQSPFDWFYINQWAVGTIALRFIDGNDAVFDYTVDMSAYDEIEERYTFAEVTQSKRITRQIFLAPGTECR